MNAAQTIRLGRQMLSETDEGLQHARILFRHVFGKHHFDYPDSLELPQTDLDRYFSLIRRRAQGEPLQYILGIWTFMDLDFKVGPGVLIPRYDTECTVYRALDILSDVPQPIVFDLCAGSGCIGISIADRRPDAKVVCIEKSPDAKNASGL